MNPPYGKGEWQLYDLAADPVETTDLAERYPEKVAQLSTDWDVYVERNHVVDASMNLKYGFQTCLYGKCFGQAESLPVNASKQ
ncbi:Arylsulfatase [compost metagenome]